MTPERSLRVVAIIPARYNSQRLPAKPLADLCGKPMIRHVYERVARAKLVNAVYVATDDDRIAAVVQGFGGNAVLTPSSLGTGSDRVAYAARSLPEADLVANVQGDEPVIEPQAIDEAVAALTRAPGVQVSTLVKKIENTAELLQAGVVKVVLDRDMNAIYFSRSPIPHARDRAQNEWVSRHCYYKHIGLYVFRRPFLLEFGGMEHTSLEEAEKLEQLRIIENGYKIRCAVTSFDTVSVDTQEDLKRVRAIIAAGSAPGKIPLP